MAKYEYLAADGGPHLFLPIEAQSRWAGGGVLGLGTDYKRACAATATSRMAAIAVGSTTALVFADPPMTSWGRSADQLAEIYYLASWGGTDLDRLIDQATAALPTASLTDSGVVLTFNEPDAFLLFAGDTPTSTAYGVHRVSVHAGNYKVLVGTYTSQRDSVAIYRLQPIR